MAGNLPQMCQDIFSLIQLIQIQLTTVVLLRWKSKIIWMNSFSIPKLWIIKN